MADVFMWLRLSLKLLTEICGVGRSDSPADLRIDLLQNHSVTVEERHLLNILNSIFISGYKHQLKNEIYIIPDSLYHSLAIPNDIVARPV